MVCMNHRRWGWEAADGRNLRNWVCWESRESLRAGYLVSWQAWSVVEQVSVQALSWDTVTVVGGGEPGGDGLWDHMRCGQEGREATAGDLLKQWRQAWGVGSAGTTESKIMYLKLQFPLKVSDMSCLHLSLHLNNGVHCFEYPCSFDSVFFQQN